MHGHLARAFVGLCISVATGCSGSTSENASDYDPDFIAFVKLADSEDSLSTLYMTSRGVTCTESEFSQNNLNPVLETQSSCGLNWVTRGYMNLERDDVLTLKELTTFDAWEEYRRLEKEGGLKETCGFEPNQLSVMGGESFTFSTEDLEGSSTGQALVEIVVDIRQRCRGNQRPVHQ